MAAFNRHQVEYVVIGGISAIAHGSAMFTKDTDFCYRRTKANIIRMVEALSDLHARPRNFEAALPFSLDVATIWNGGTSLSATCLWQPKLRRYTVNKVAQRVAPIFIGGSFRCYPAQLYFLENSVAARRRNQRARRIRDPAWVT